MNSEEREKRDREIEEQLKWSDAELEQLAEAKPDDPSTWPVWTW